MAGADSITATRHSHSPSLPCHRRHVVSVAVAYCRRRHSRHQTPSTGYNILPSTIAVFSYAIGSRKLSANEQFFVDAQTVVSLLQTTQIKQSVSCIATNKVYSSENKTTIVPIEKELFLTRGGCVSCLRACFGVRLLLQSLLVPEPFGEC